MSGMQKQQSLAYVPVIFLPRFCCRGVETEWMSFAALILFYFTCADDFSNNRQ